MKDLFVNNSFNFINHHKKLDHYNQVKIKYGLEVMYHVVTKTFVIFLLSFIFNITFYTFCIFIFYSILRAYTHGIHSNNNLICWAVSLTTYVLCSFMAKYLAFNYFSIITLSFISLISFILWSPSDTPGRPLINSKVRRKLKIKSIITLLLEIMLLTLFKIIRNPILISMVIASVNINPATYKLAGVRYQNYKYYTGK